MNEEEINNLVDLICGDNSIDKINEIMDYKQRIDKAIEYIEKSLHNNQPYYEYLFGDENGEVQNLDKLLDILKGE